MKISLCTIGLRDYRLSETFEIMHEMGICYADALAYGKQAHLSRAMSKSERDGVYGLADTNGIHICSLAGDVGDDLTSDEPAARETELKRMEAEIDLAVEAGATVVRVSPGTWCTFI